MQAGFGGTSFAAPLWAGFMALVNQQSLQNGGGLAGFINPAIYAIGLTRGSANDLYSTCFNNINDGMSNANWGASLWAGGQGVSLADFRSVPGYNLTTGWGTPTCALINQLAPPPPPAPREPVSCSVFDDGYTNQQGPTDAIYIHDNNGTPQACMPSNTPGPGICHKWFGLCATNTTKTPVNLYVFDDGYTNQQGPSNAVYIHAKSDGSLEECIPSDPSVSAIGFCHKWFGLGATQDGRSVNFMVFDNGYTNMQGPSNAVYMLNQSGIIKSCIPSNPSASPIGFCHDWFGRGQAVGQP
ncbi:MAG: hypothetical protein ACLPHP_04025 [Candidatus Sulfotelmatobacter sp.]